jgi:hypothetical protein
MSEAWAAEKLMEEPSVPVAPAASCSSCAHFRSVPTARMTSSAAAASATAAAMPEVSVEEGVGTPRVVVTVAPPECCWTASTRFQ